MIDPRSKGILSLAAYSHSGTQLCSTQVNHAEPALPSDISIPRPDFRRLHRKADGTKSPRESAKIHAGAHGKPM